MVVTFVRAARRIPILRRLVAQAFLLLAAAQLGGCEAHRLSQAQDAFSQGAQQENRLAALDGVAMTDYSPAFTYYQRADAILVKDLADKKSELTSDNLLATGYALQAMTLWRLVDLSTIVPAAQIEGERREGPSDGSDPASTSDRYRQRARAARQEAQKLKAQLGPRDVFMMTVLPNLMDHDTGLQYLGKSDPKRAHDFFKSAFAGVETALNDTSTVPPNHDVRVYARLVEVQILTAWYSAFNDGFGGSAGELTKARACQNKWILPSLRAARDDVDKLNPRAKATSSQFFAVRLERLGLNAEMPNHDGVGGVTCPWQ